MESFEMPDNELLKPESTLSRLKYGSVQLDYELKYLTFRDYCCRKRVTNFINLLKEKNEEYSFHLEILNQEKRRLHYLQMEVEELSRRSQNEANWLRGTSMKYLTCSMSNAFEVTASYVTSAANTAKSLFDVLIDFMDFPK